MKLLLTDCETTGLGKFAKPPQTDAVIEVGCVLWDTEYRAVVSTWSDLVVHDSNAALAVNKIPVGLLKSGAYREEALTTLRGLAQRADVVVAHRAEFDHEFIGDIDRGDLCDPRIIPWLCSKYHLEWPLSKPGDGLAYVAIAHHVPVTEAHRALSDCLLLARCFERVAELGHNVDAMIRRAMRPRREFEAVVSYDKRELAKSAGFSWNGDHKKWTKSVAIEDAGSFPFQVKPV